MTENEALYYLRIAQAAKWARYLEKSHFHGEDAQMERGDANRDLDALIAEAVKQGIL